MVSSMTWHDLETQFRAAFQQPFDLRADWHHVVGRPGVSTWTIVGVTTAQRLRVERLARLAGSLFAEPGEDSLTAWLDRLKTGSHQFSYRPPLFEVNPDGSRGTGYVFGTLANLCEESANLCLTMEIEAFETERARDPERPGEQKPTSKGGRPSEMLEVDRDAIARLHEGRSRKAFAHNCDLSEDTLARAEVQGVASKATLGKIVKSFNKLQKNQHVKINSQMLKKQPVETRNN